MATIIRKAINGYETLFYDLPDHRFISWPFVSKPYQVLFLVTLYLMFVLKWGPEWMKNRKPFNVEKIMIVYNAMQVAACSYIFVQAIRCAWGWRYKWVCEPSDYSQAPESLEIAKLTYFYFIMKVADLMDTVFFVLRKKNNQISFLHLYHHTGMVVLIWAATTYYPGGHGSLVGVINSFVHAVMYSYYLATVAKPSFKNEIWIKKHITQLQILQFFLCVVHMSTSVFKPDCGYPRWISAVFLPQDLFMLALFLDFYKKTYVNKPTSKAKEALNETMLKNINGNLNSINGLTKSDLNESINGEVERTVITGSASENNGHIYRINYKDVNNHCEQIIENNDPKYKKND